MMDNQNKKYTFHVHGMHCDACVLLTEEEVKSIPNVISAKTSLKNHSIEVVGNFGEKGPKEIAEMLTRPLKSHGYTIGLDREIVAKKWSDFRYALPIALLFAIGFVLLQKLGIVNLVNSSSVTYGTAFVIGIIASLSTCMAVVGGLVLSMSATFAKEGDKVRPQVMFHIGRLVSFFILGGVIGAIGSAFSLNLTATNALNIVIGIVMLILGINLLDVFPWAKRLQPSMPKFLGKNAIRISKLNHILTPILLGIATFFLPCGFTYSMQVYSLSTGSFLAGALTMTAFALGTLPVLALVSFSSFSIRDSSKSGIFFKTAGLVVIMFALFNLVNSLVVMNVLPPVFNF